MNPAKGTAQNAALRATLDAQIVELISSDSVVLTPYPAVVMRLQALIAEPDYALSDLSDVLRTDATLSATILRRANSASFGAAPTVTDLDAALTRIGAKQLVQVVLAAELGSAICAASALAPLRFAVWRDALITAHLAQALAEHRGCDPAEAFLAGLLHDFGKVVGLVCIEAILREQGEKLAPQSECFWLEVAEQYHLDLGLVMATKWELPDVYKHVISRHHSAAESLEENGRSLVGLMATVDGVAAALAKSPRLEDIDFVALVPETLERGVVVELCATLPATVAALGAQEHAPTAEVSLVAKHAADGGLPASFAVRYQGDNEPELWQAVSISDELLRVHSSRFLHENTLARIAIEWGPEWFELWVNVRAVEQLLDRSWQLDLAPFALGKTEGERWQRIVQRVALPDGEHESLAWLDVLLDVSSRVARCSAELVSKPTTATLAQAKALVDEGVALLDSSELLDSFIEADAVATAATDLREALARLPGQVVEAKARATAPSSKPKTSGPPPSARRKSGASRPRLVNSWRLLAFALVLVLAIGGRVAFYFMYRPGPPVKAGPAAFTHGKTPHGATLTTMAPSGAQVEARLRAGLPVVLGIDLVRRGNSLRALAHTANVSAKDVVSYRWLKNDVRLQQKGAAIKLSGAGSYQVEVKAVAGTRASQPVKSGLLRIR